MLVTLPLLTLTGLYFWLVIGDRSARYFFVANGAMLVSGMVHVSMSMEIIPSYELFRHIVSMAGCVAITLLTLALSSRVRRLRDEWVMTEASSREEQEKISHRLVEGNRLKGEFLDAVSHELENPIRSITENINQIEEPESEDQKKLVKDIQQSALGVSELMNHLMSLTGGQLRADRLDEMPFNIERQLKILREGMSSSLVSQGKELRLDINPVMPDTLYGDVEKLFKALRYVINEMAKVSDDRFITIKASTYQHEHEDKIGVMLKVTGVVNEEPSSEEPEGLWWPVCRQLMHVMGGAIAFSAIGQELCFELSLGCRLVSNAS